MTKKKKRIVDIDNVDTATNVAKLLDVSRTTLLSAEEAGSVRGYRTPGGALLIDIDDARKWNEVNEAKREKRRERAAAGLF